MFNDKDSVIIYRVQIEALLACSSLKDVKSILAMILERGINGNEVDCPEHLRMVWTMFQRMLDENNGKWQERCEANRRAGKASAAKRQQTSTTVDKCQQTSTTVDKCQQTSTTVDKCQQTSTDNDNDNDIIHPLSNESVCNSAGARTRTHESSSGKVKKVDYPKSPEDVLALAKAINLDMSPEQAEKYFLYRAQRNWKVGSGSGAFQLNPENVPENMRLWVNGDKAEAARGKAAEINNEGDEYYGVIGGKYIPRH